ncbi:MAG: hypothetical protein AAFN70_17770, partial [Planctomycetota bacterium]
NKCLQFLTSLLIDHGRKSPGRGLRDKEQIAGAILPHPPFSSQREIPATWAFIAFDHAMITAILAERPPKPAQKETSEGPCPIAGVREVGHG